MKLIHHHFSPLHIEERGVCVCVRERERASQSLGVEHHYDGSSVNCKAKTTLSQEKAVAAAHNKYGL